MSNVISYPKNWTVRELSEISILITDGAHFSPVPQEYGEIIANVKDIQGNGINYEGCTRILKSDFEFLVRQSCSPKNGDVLLSKDGTIGKVVLFESETQVVLLSSIAIIRLEKEVWPDFIKHVLRSFIFDKQLYALQSGSALKRIVLADIKKLRITFPEFEQQQKIAKILSTVDKLIEKTQSLIDKYTDIKQGMMADLFTRGIDLSNGPDGTPASNPNYGQLRPCFENAPELYKETELGWVPKEWEVKLLGDISNISSGITLGNEYSGSDALEVPYLRVANVQDGYLDLTEIKTVKIPPSNFHRYLLEVGDVLMNEGGDFDKLGRGTIWNGEIAGCAHQNHVFKVRANRPELIPEYLAYWSASSFGKSYFVINSKQSTNLASINSSQLKRFPVLVSTVHEQKEIVNRLKAIDDNILKLVCDVEKNKKVKKGLMQDLLTGKVRVV